MFQVGEEGEGGGGEEKEKKLKSSCGKWLNKPIFKMGNIKSDVFSFFFYLSFVYSFNFFSFLSLPCASILGEIKIEEEARV